MKFKLFAVIFTGFIFIGISIGYILGFYAHKFLNNNMFYLAALFMGMGIFLLIYGALFKK